MIEIRHRTEEIPYESTVLGLVVVTPDNVLTMTQDVFSAFKSFIREMRFREGDYILDVSALDQPRLLIVDFDHEKYSTRLPDMTAKTVLFKDARAWPL